MHSKFTTLVISGFLLLLTACASPATQVKVEKSERKAAPARTTSVAHYKIGIDDLVQINVWKNPELSVIVPVRPDGMISMPLIGDVKAGGYSPEEVAANIEKHLGSYIRSPKVAVIVTELRSHLFLSRVRVTGAVNRPISLPYRQGMTVLDAVLEAGGTNDFASPNRAKLYRKTDAGTRVFQIRLNDILTQGELKTNIELQAGDIISVPEKLF